MYVCVQTLIIGLSPKRYCGFSWMHKITYCCPCRFSFIENRFLCIRHGPIEACVRTLLLFLFAFVVHLKYREILWSCQRVRNFCFQPKYLAFLFDTHNTELKRQIPKIQRICAEIIASKSQWFHYMQISFEIVFIPKMFSFYEEKKLNWISKKAAKVKKTDNWMNKTEIANNEFCKVSTTCDHNPNE